MSRLVRKSTSKMSIRSAINSFEPSKNATLNKDSKLTSNPTDDDLTKKLVADQVKPILATLEE
jgi:hypothetical protein